MRKTAGLSHAGQSARGLPIGNLTSQIFANIYLNEFDQFVASSLKPLGYVRYGDDFVLWCRDEPTTAEARLIATQFLGDELRLTTNPKHDRVQPVRHKLAYLGIDLWPSGRRLPAKTVKRIEQNLCQKNLSSYHALLQHHQSKRHHKRFSWQTLDITNLE